MPLLVVMHLLSRDRETLGGGPARVARAVLVMVVVACVALVLVLTL